jgi:hypothetical protein
MVEEAVMSNEVYFSATWPLDRAMAEPSRWWRAFHLRLAREHVRGARQMFARRDDIGTIVGIGCLVHAVDARKVARTPLGEAPQEGVH